jgi:hypothetical protein
MVAGLIPAALAVLILVAQPTKLPAGTRCHFLGLPAALQRLNLAQPVTPAL